MMHMKRGNGADQQPLLTADSNDDALLNIEPAVHAIRAPPYSTNIPMQPTSTATSINVQTAPSSVHVTTQPVAYGGGSVFVVSQPVKPNPHCCLSVVSFVLCPVFGLIAWMCACCTSCENDRNNFEGAKCRSSCACGWAVTGIVLGLLGAIVVLVLFLCGVWVFARTDPHTMQDQQVKVNVVDAVQDGIHNVGDVADNAVAKVNRMVNGNGNSITDELNRGADQVGDAFHKLGDAFGGH